MCKKKTAETRVQTIVLRMCRTRQSALICGLVCFDTSTDAAVRETEWNAESEVCLGLKITDHVKRVREVLSMRALWEQSLVYTRHVSRSGKNDANTEETTADGMENLVFKKAK